MPHCNLHMYLLIDIWTVAGVTIKVHVGVKSLEIELEVDKNLQNKTRGLLGNFNGNLLDEFSLPNGTVLSSNLSQRGIYEHFAKECKYTLTDMIFRMHTLIGVMTMLR